MATVDDRNRLHGFDNVRGLAAVAVVALHASYAYALFPLEGLVWPVPLEEPSRVADALFWWFEGSIMPLFFVLSGYFLARSLAGGAPAAVIVSRTRRLLLPMTTVGFVVLAIDLHVWVLGLIATDRATIREYRRLKFSPEIQSELFGPAHLWYVEYLWLMCVIACGSVLLYRLARRSPAMAKPFAILPAACTFAGLIAAAVILLSYHPAVVLGFQHGWLPDAAKFAHGSLFFLAGMLLARSPRLLESIRRFSSLSLGMALGSFLFLLPLIHETLGDGRPSRFDPTLGLLLALFAAAATFGQLGAGLRWFDRRNTKLAQLAEASFWIYIVHHPVLGLLQIALRPLPVPPLIKFGLVLTGTLAVCLLSYRWIVQGGVIERLLGGEHPWRALRRRETAAIEGCEHEGVRKAA